MFDLIVVGVVSLPGPWAFWNNLTIALGTMYKHLALSRAKQLVLQLRFCEIRFQKAGSAEYSTGFAKTQTAIRDVLLATTAKIAHLEKYMPWDGVQSLPGPWSFWNYHTTALGDALCGLLESRDLLMQQVPD